VFQILPAFHNEHCSELLPSPLIESMSSAARATLPHRCNKRPSEGATVGSAEGRLVGLGEGSTVGLEGTCVGKVDVGAILGCGDGSIEGKDDGIEVG